MEVKREIIKAADSVRKKYRLLKKGLIEDTEQSQKYFEPLVKPLKTLIDLNKSSQNELSENSKKDVEVSKKVPKKKTRQIVSKLPQSSFEIPEPSRAITEENDYNVSAGGEEEILTSEESFNEGNEWDTWFNYIQTYYGPLSREYLTGLVKDVAKKGKTGNFDYLYGVHLDPETQKWNIGRTIVEFDRADVIHVGSQMYQLDRGLAELIFKKFPDKNTYGEQQLQTYKNILELTNAHLQGYNAEARIASSASYKYNNIISILFTNRGKRKKGGKLHPQSEYNKIISNLIHKKRRSLGLVPLTNKKVRYVYWNSLDELVDRLLLLKSSEQAGNFAHRQEISEIEEELREENIIQ